MSINLDVIIGTPELAVDMKAGLDSLQGVSDAARLITESVLSEKVPKRLLHNGSVRTTLKKNFSGSYGQLFSIDIYDDGMARKLRGMGRSVFAEIFTYFIDESLYKETQIISPRAQKIVDTLGDSSDELVSQLRVSILRNIHTVSTKFNHDVKIRFRKSASEKIVLASFDKSTARFLLARESAIKSDLIVCITRLNIYTGNGRLQVQGEGETVPFGFGTEYKEVAIEAKKIFSENLNHNNGIDSDKWLYLKISAAAIKMRDGKILKYIVKGFYP